VVVIRGKGWVYDELRRRGVNPVLLDAKGSFNWRYLLGLLMLIRREGVDLIQSHLLGSNVYCALAGLLSRTPVVATFHGSVDVGDRERLKELKFTAINAGADHVIAVTDSLRDDLVERTRLNPERIKIIYNGIDVSRFQRPRSSALRQKYGWSEDEIIVGSLGNIRPAKGYDILLQAAALLGGSERSCRFVIAGQSKENDSLYDELLALRKALGLEDRVRFLGFVDDAPEFLAGVDLFLSSSISEGLPLSAIQAMVAGVPVVATRCGGYERLITDGVNGCLVEVNNPAAIAEAVASLANDPCARAGLSENANRYAVDTFDIEVMLRAYEDSYEQLTGPGLQNR